MTLKILQNKIIVIETFIILISTVIIIFLGIKLKKTSSFSINISQFENNKIVTIEPKSKDKDGLIHFWINSDNKIRNAEFITGEYSMHEVITENEILSSTIDYPYFNETSFISPKVPGEIQEENIKDIFLYKKFTLKNGEIFEFIIDNNGNAKILENLPTSSVSSPSEHAGIPPTNKDLQEHSKNQADFT